MQFESSIRQQQIIEEESSNEWDFEDDINLHIKDLADTRKHCDAIVQPEDRSTEMLHDSLPKNLNPAVLKRPWVENPPNIEQELTSLKFARKGKSNYCLSEMQRKSLCGNHNLMDHKRELDLYCGEYLRNSESGFQGVEERESYLSDSQLEKEATSETPKSYSMSHFLSSMDDGKFDKREAFQVFGQTPYLLDGEGFIKMIGICVVYPGYRAKQMSCRTCKS